MRLGGAGWITYNTANSGLANNVVNAIAVEGPSTVWFATNGWASRLDGNGWTTFTSSNSGLPDWSVHTITIDYTGAKWFGTSHGTARFDGTTWTVYRAPFGGADGIADDDVRAIAVESNGTRWFGTFSNGVSRFDRTTWTNFRWSGPSSLASNGVAAIAVDGNGVKWFGTNNGLSRFDGASWTTGTTANGLAGDAIKAIAVDRTGAKWFGTYVGVTKLEEANAGVATATTIPSPTATATATATTTATSTATSTPTVTPTPEEQRTSLHPGWNWVSFYVAPASQTVSDVLNSIDGKYDFVVGEFGTYAAPPADPTFNTLTTLGPGKTYFVRMKQAADLRLVGWRVPSGTPLVLASGWRWIGHLPPAGGNLPAVLAALDGKYDLVLGETGVYAPPPALQILNNLSRMEPGRGYLIRMTREGTLTY